jgi:hypothetical protein
VLEPGEADGPPRRAGLLDGLDAAALLAG